MNHQEFVALQERVEMWADRAALVVVPTVKTGAVLALAHLAAQAFGLHTQSLGAAAVLLGLLWLRWAWQRWTAAPVTGLVERNVRRRKAREADARGHCVTGSNCPVCRGVPSKPDGAP